MTETENVNTSQVSAASSKIGAMDILEIQALLPHRYPFLLIDRVLALLRIKTLMPLRSYTIIEPFFTAYFPGNPIRPGLLYAQWMAHAVAGSLITVLME